MILPGRASLGVDGINVNNDNVTSVLPPRILARHVHLHQFEKAERPWRVIEEKVNVRVSASLPACGWAKPRATHADRQASDIN
jgi:hypothetical protein